MKLVGRRLSILYLLLVVVLLFAGCANDPTKPGDASDTVYVTESGTKYHRGDCSYLSQSKVAISCSEAVSRGYTACSKCKPNCG